MTGRVKCGDTEGEIVVAHDCRKRKKLICGPEEEIVVAHGRLPSPARTYKPKTLHEDVYSLNLHKPQAQCTLPTYAEYI